MELLPVRLPLLHEGDDLVSAVCERINLNSDDIVAVSSKAVAIVEGAAIDLSKIEVTDEALAWEEKLKRTKRNPAFRQAILNEAVRLNGKASDACPQAMLCELKPDGVDQGTVLAVNAGLDLSNIPDAFAIGWPIDCVASVRRIKAELEDKQTGPFGVVLTDSCCRPRRVGVTAMALTVAGFDPIKNMVGSKDLYGHELAMTMEATADQLATAANFLMGNSSEQIPVVVIRGHNLPMTDYCGWVDGIDPEEDLFRGLL